jgi:hypothetical protein
MTTQEKRARKALHDLGLEIADRWASGFEKHPTQQLVLQKLIDPVVRHILNTIFPWIVGVAILFLILLICTVVTCVIVLRSGPGPVPGPVPVSASASAISSAISSASTFTVPSKIPV